MREGLPRSTAFSMGSKLTASLYGDDFHELKPVNLLWRLHEQQVQEHRKHLAQSHGVLPHGFVLLSWIFMYRYTTGVVDSLSHHFPLLHMATFSLTAHREAPELVLEMLSMGTQYHLEYKVASSLYTASRAIILERIRLGELPDLGKAVNGPLSRSPLDLIATCSF
ncbi:hypothetical protein IWZ03DRAFT_145041 [Phyllosticta citriasiana]|uniref:Uncharacterized protein n=1 Tax=Phyllosticta citriasiana TaxID=595635 RepID=A0ABR1KUN5_9PEZI